MTGRLVTTPTNSARRAEIELERDPKTRDVGSAKADNLIVRTAAYAKDPGQTALRAAYEALVKPRAGARRIDHGHRCQATRNTAGEAYLGQIIADAQLGREPVRSGRESRDCLHQSGRHSQSIPRRAKAVVTSPYCSRSAVGNFLVKLTLTGTQIRRLPRAAMGIQPQASNLQVSKAFPTPGTIGDARRLVPAKGELRYRTPHRSCEPGTASR